MKKVFITTLIVLMSLNISSKCFAVPPSMSVNIKDNTLDIEENKQNIKVNPEVKSIVFSNEDGKPFIDDNGNIMVPVGKIFKILNMENMQIRDHRVMGYYNGEMVELYRDGRFLIGGKKLGTIENTTSLDGIIYAPLDKIMENLHYKIVDRNLDSLKIEKMNVSESSYIDLERLTYRTLSKEEQEQEILLVSKTIDGEAYNQLDEEQLEQLKHSDVDEVKEKISTIYDFVAFLNVKGFSMDSGALGEQQIRDRKNNHTYHYNFEAAKVYNNNVGNCGGIANLAKYILEDNYEEVGYIHTARADNSGHVINYFLKDGFYYLVDFTDFPADSREGMFRGKFSTMEESLSKYGKNDVLIYYYSNYEYQIPSTGGKNAKVRYLPKECNDIIILRQEGISIDFLTTFPKEIIPNKVMREDV